MLPIDSVALTHGEAENFFPKIFPKESACLIIRLARIWSQHWSRINRWQVGFGWAFASAGRQYLKWLSNGSS